MHPEEHPKQEMEEQHLTEHSAPNQTTTPESGVGAWAAPQLPGSLNEELEEKIKDNPNRFIGCGG